VRWRRESAPCVCGALTASIIVAANESTNSFKNLLTSEAKEEKLYSPKLALAAAGPLTSKYDIESKTNAPPHLLALLVAGAVGVLVLTRGGWWRWLGGGYSDVLRNLYEFRFAVRVWHMLSENMTTEMSSRMNAMSNSSKAAGEMLAYVSTRPLHPLTLRVLLLTSGLFVYVCSSLTLLYNRTRQAKITTELIEIVSGAAALEQGRE
jgi:hypothetical protein